MSVKIMSRVLELDIPPTQKFVLLIFADHCNDEGMNAFPSKGQVARKTGYSESTVHDAVRALRAAGLLQAYAHQNGGRSNAVRYRVCPEKGAALAPLGGKGCGWHPPLQTERVQLAEQRVRLAPPESLEPPVEAAAAARKVLETKAFNLFGAKQRFGTKPFREKGAEAYETRNPADSVVDLMEQIIVSCQDADIPVPGEFFTLKRAAERSARDIVEEEVL